MSAAAMLAEVSKTPTVKGSKAGMSSSRPTARQTQHFCATAVAGTTVMKASIIALVTSEWTRDIALSSLATFPSDDRCCRLAPLIAACDRPENRRGACDRQSRAQALAGAVAGVVMVLPFLPAPVAAWRRKAHAQVHHRTALPAAGMGCRGEGLHCRRSA